VKPGSPDARRIVRGFVEQETRRRVARQQERDLQAQGASSPPQRRTKLAKAAARRVAL